MRKVRKPSLLSFPTFIQEPWAFLNKQQVESLTYEPEERVKYILGIAMPRAAKRGGAPYISFLQNLTHQI